MKRALATAAVLLFACTSEPLEVRKAGNGVRVELLFVHEGCRMYRFYDGGSPRYFVRCGSDASAQWSESCGKNCARRHEVQTVTLE